MATGDGGADRGGQRREADRASLLQTVRAVAWSFFGVRRSADHAEDVRKVDPVHLVVVGIVIAALFVGALVLLVTWVVGSGIATGA